MLQVTPYRKQLHIDHVARLARFNAAAVPDYPIRILSASQRTGEASDLPKRTLPAPISNDEAYAQVWPWIPPEGGTPAIAAKIPEIKLIQSIVASAYEISRMDMISARRFKILVRPRQIAMYLCKLLTLHSLPIIGHHFGGRDHATIIHAICKMDGLIVKDEAFAAEIEVLRAKIMGAVA